MGNLLAHVVPAQPLRQWVLSLPFALRAPLAYLGGLMSVVARVFEDSLLRWYQHRLAPGDHSARDGLLNVIQRSSDDMRLNPHLHVVALDGVYVAGPYGQPVFRPLGRLKTDDVADVFQVTKARVLRALERRGVVRVNPEALEVDDALEHRDPVLAQLAAAAVAGLSPAGPAERKREPVALAAAGALEIVGDLAVQDGGFNLHAKTRAGTVDDKARARPLRYVLCRPLANDRFAILPDHRVRLTLKRPWSDGDGCGAPLPPWRSGPAPAGWCRPEASPARSPRPTLVAGHLVRSRPPPAAAGAASLPLHVVAALHATTDGRPHDVRRTLVAVPGLYLSWRLSDENVATRALGGDAIRSFALAR